MSFIIKHLNQQIEAVKGNKDEATQLLLDKYGFVLEETDDVVTEYEGKLHTQSYVNEQEEIKAEFIRQAKVNDLKKELIAIDEKGARAVRAILAGMEDENDEAHLIELEQRAIEIRNQIAELEIKEEIQEWSEE